MQAVKELDPQNQEAADYVNRSLKALESEANDSNEAAPQVQVYEIGKDPKRSREFYSQGLLLYSQGKIKEAATAWGQAVQVDNSNVLARNAYNRAITELKATP
jgi:hypothetical protein